ncbi:UDP-N-acetylmuramate dehydrogenase [Oribacterium sp. WCC10]|uniref:UDP-N-acetylmuramate dehydrogenase n=1 Tax=Oribacterium sp. WCC10 TaxID=1855343 RepID=UPI0008EA987F|nr:UDP-N-acetylmuramate dehydrogenase [Oribacterium sp. WCC10]SFG29294.1 UDP-N-acetylmuramate dehydrogenase [Oribacterium sp. WCC10]
MKVLKNEPLKKHTSFKVGGPAKVYSIPEDEYELRKLIEFLHDEDIAYQIIGNGTNLLVSDSGVDSVVIEIGKSLDGIELLEDAVSGKESKLKSSEEAVSDGKIYRIRALAGTSLGKTAQFAANHSLAGMEALRGIPGTVGGAVTMNAGAYGTEMKDVLETVEVLTRDGKQLTLKTSDLELGYRHSIVPEKEYVVVAATFALKKGDKKAIGELMADYQNRRKEKQPIDKYSAGSTFKRPEGHFAGKLIEDCGLRGYRHGGAQVSEKHCGFVINDGTARASDIYWIIGEIRKRVLLEQGVELTPEVKLWGNF